MRIAGTSRVYRQKYSDLKPAPETGDLDVSFRNRLLVNIIPTGELTSLAHL